MYISIFIYIYVYTYIHSLLRHKYVFSFSSVNFRGSLVGEGSLKVALLTWVLSFSPRRGDGYYTYQKLYIHENIRRIHYRFQKLETISFNACFMLMSYRQFPWSIPNEEVARLQSVAGLLLRTMLTYELLSRYAVYSNKY